MKRFIKTAFFVCLTAMAAFSCEEPKVAVTGVQIIPTEKTLTVGDKLDIMVVVTPDNATNPKYVLSVTDPAVLTLEGQTVTAVAAGDAIVTATTEEGAKKAECKITVIKKEEKPGNDDDNTGDDNTGDDNTGDDNTGDDNTGDDNTGDDNTGDDNTGDDNTGDDNTGDDNTGDDNTGDEPSTKVDFSITLNEVAIDDIIFSVDVASDTVHWFVWCEESRIIGNYSDKQLSDYTLNTIIPLFPTEMNKGSQTITFTFAEILENNGGKGDAANKKMSWVYQIGADVVREIKPETEYIVYGMAFNTKTKEVISDVIKRKTTTPKREYENAIMLKGQSPCNIIVDVTVADENMPYFLFLKKKTEMDAFATDDDLIAYDLENEIKPLWNGRNNSLKDYLNQGGGMRDCVFGYNYLSAGYLEDDTEYVAYFYGFDSNGEVCTDVYKADVKTDAIVPSNVTFEVNVTSRGEGNSIANIEIIPSDETVYYYRITISDSEVTSTGKTPEEIALLNYIGDGAVYGGIRGLAAYGMLDYVKDWCTKGTYSGSLKELHLTYEAGSKVHIVQFTVDVESGAITSDVFVNTVQ